MLTINELFAGIGAFRNALIRLNIPHEIVGISEIDKFAITSYEAMYGKTRNYGDISKISKLDYADMWTYGFPCQDISIAGYQKGITEKTRSGLLLEVQRLLVVAKEHNELPKYLIMENVKNLVGKKFMPDFQRYLDWLDELGYNTYWKVLDAKDFGIPQSRLRVFAISIRKDLNKSYSFPEPFPLEFKLQDFLETDVDEKYYINSELTGKLLQQLSDKDISNTVRGGGRGSIDGTHTWDMVLTLINPDNNNTCRTIKAQYANTSAANMLRKGTFGATGVMEVKRNA